VDLREQMAVVRSWLLVIVFAAVLAGVAAYLVSGVLPPTYESRAKVLFGQETTNPNVDLQQAAQNLSNTYAEVATTRSFLRAVMARAGLGGPVEEVEKKIAVKPDQNLPFIEIVATDRDPNVAAAIANGMVEELKKASEAITGDTSKDNTFLTTDLAATQALIEQTRATIAVLQRVRNPTDADAARLEGLVNRLVALRQTYVSLLGFAAPAANRLTVVDPADVPTGPSSPRPLLNTAIAVILGILVATGLAFVWEKYDDRVKTPEDVEKVTGLPTIGTIIRMPSERGRKEFYRLATLLFPRSVAAEAFRTIRTNLEFASLDKALGTITVTSSVPGEGKSVVSGNIAVAFAQAGRRTILVDADLRRPGLHALFGIPNNVGLTDMVLSDNADVGSVVQRTEEPNLRVITSGAVPANPAELLGSHRMAVILQRITAEADLVVLDTPPVGIVTDGALVAARSDSTLLVVNPDRSSERMVRKAREALAHVNARVVGVVLNNVSRRDAEPNPYYGLYRPAGSKSAGKDKPRKGPPTDGRAEVPSPFADGSR
jgi:succinoglycan biosynthesis transport protein ExoP